MAKAEASATDNITENMDYAKQGGRDGTLPLRKNILKPAVGGGFHAVPQVNFHKRLCLAGEK